MRVTCRATGTVYEVTPPASGAWSVGHDPMTGVPVFKGIPEENIRVAFAGSAD